MWWLMRTSLSRLSSFINNCGDETGILALKLMCNRNLHAIERICWLLIFIVFIYGVIFTTNLQISRYLKSPTVMSADRNYRDWDGFMPAITFCYDDRMDPYKANEYLLKNWNVSALHEDYYYFIDFVNAVVNATANNYYVLAKFASDERFEDVDLYAIVQDIRKPFNRIIQTFEGNFEMSVEAVMTERGSCHVMNSAVAEVLTLNSSHPMFDNLRPPLKCKFGKQKCFIKIDLLESVGFVDVHSPFEISSDDASFLALQKSQEILASYKVMETIASSNLRDLGIDQRNCVFHDEETSDLKIYSKSLCLAKCRAMVALEMCNCVPFFYTFVEGPSCNPAGFECLFDFNWPIWTSHICKCPNTCTEVDYTIQTAKQSSWAVNNMDVNGKPDIVASTFRLDLIPPKVRLRRDVVFSFEDLLVSLGGTLALFLGLSILSVLSFLYVLTECVFEDVYLLAKLICKMYCHIKVKLLRRHDCKKNVIIVNE